MLARTRRGWTRRADAESSVAYLKETGSRVYRAPPGNRGAWVLRRDDGERTEFVTLTYWDSLEAVKRVARKDVGEAVVYPEDERFLINRELCVTHYLVDD